MIHIQETLLDPLNGQWIRYKDCYDFWSGLTDSFWVKRISQKKKLFFGSYGPKILVPIVCYIICKLIRNSLTTTVTGSTCLLSNLLNIISDFVNNWHMYIIWSQARILKLGLQKELSVVSLVVWNFLPLVYN